MMKSETRFEGFVPIHTIFYTIFHPTEGPKVCYQFPPNNLQNSNINFDSIKNYIIPKPQLCHRLLTIKYGNYRIASFPVAVNSVSYARNYFRFNFVFVFRYDCETSPYEPAITRLGKMFRSLEEQSRILSRSERESTLFKNDSETIINAISSNNKDNNNDNITNIVDDHLLLSVQDIIMRLYQDLNNYSECLIPIDEGNAIDIKIFPLVKTPVSVQLSIEDVPILVVNLSKIVDLNWDPTMISILPFVNGLNNIQNISKLSDCDSNLVIECIKHLLYYKCVIITDIFQFSNSYAPTSLITQFLLDPAMANDCQTFVTLPMGSKLIHLPFSDNATTDTSNNDNDNRQNKTHRKSRSIPSSINSTDLVNDNTSNNSNDFYSNPIRKRSESSFSSDGGKSGSSKFKNHRHCYPTKSILFDLYISLSQCITLKEWYKQNYYLIKDNFIDIRKFILFGVIKKIIYRIKSYPIMKKRNIVFQNERKDTEQKGSYKLKNEKDLNDKLKDTKLFLSTSDIKFENGDKLLNSIYKKLSRVSFENSSCSKYNQTRNHRNSGPLSDDKNVKDPLILEKDEKVLLLKSLENIESFDKICVRLGRSRLEIEQILNDIGDFKIISC